MFNRVYYGFTPLRHSMSWYYTSWQVHVHNSTMCINHSNSLTGCCTWSKFLIFSPHHSYGTFVTNWFVADDNSFILSFLCYRWLSFRSHEYSLHRVFTWLLLIVCFCFFFWLCLFVFSFALHFWWMGSHPWFFNKVFLQPLYVNLHVHVISFCLYILGIVCMVLR